MRDSLFEESGSEAYDGEERYEEETGHGMSKRGIMAEAGPKEGGTVCMVI